MPASGEVITFVATTDMNRAAVFYEGVIGLRIVAKEPTALVFDANGTMLRVSKVDEHTPPQHTVLGWSVGDINQSLGELVGKGVLFERFDMLEQDESGICTFPNGDQVAWFRDPDGNMLSITQFVADGE
jgi:catechol 2,3-dioxygenase-like lactoylglutathione lyase family enzyme